MLSACRHLLRQCNQKSAAYGDRTLHLCIDCWVTVHVQVKGLRQKIGLLLDKSATDDKLISALRAPVARYAPAADGGGAHWLLCGMRIMRAHSKHMLQLSRK